MLEIRLRGHDWTKRKKVARRQFYGSEKIYKLEWCSSTVAFTRLSASSLKIPACPHHRYADIYIYHKYTHIYMMYIYRDIQIFTFFIWYVYICDYHAHIQLWSPKQSDRRLTESGLLFTRAWKQGEFLAPVPRAGWPPRLGLVRAASCFKFVVIGASLC